MAFTDFQKKLEAFYKTFDLSDKLFYERRSKQYQKDKNIRIVDKINQIKTFSSLFLNKAHLATRYYGTLIKEFGNLLFQNDHKLIIYYTSSILMFHLDSFIRKNIVNRKYNKFRYFILMALKWEIIDYEKVPYFNSKDIEEYCNKLIGVSRDETILLSKIQNILTKLDTFISDFSNLELTKSKKIADDLESQYKK